jgi:uncharacterized protein (TIGR04255 family)
MTFPESPRVIYNKNPLVEVICQLRFPTILQVSAEPPVAFQEAIRDLYPILEDKTQNPLAAFGAQLSHQVMSLLSRGLPSPARVYEFASADGAWRVALTQDALSLTALRYERWEDFKRMFRPAIDALVSFYRPAFYSRIGLRYVDLVRRSTLGLAGVGWPELVAPHVLGVLSTELAAQVQSAFGEAVLDLGGAGQVRLRHGLRRDDAGGPSEPEECYLIDADFFVESRTETQHVDTALDALNQQSGRLFRWCIQPQLHERMDPSAA